MAVGEVVNELNRESDEWTPHKVGRILSRLSFMRRRMAAGIRGYVIDYKLLQRLCNRYKIPMTLDDVSLLSKKCHNVTTPEIQGF